MDLLILAGGMGSRFGGLKQVEPIHENGEFIIDYSIYDAIQAGFDRVIFLIKEEMYDTFRETIGKRVEKFIKTEYVFQSLNDLPAGYSVSKDRVKPWGTAHAVLCCKDVIKGKFAIINSDDFYGRDTYVQLADALKKVENNQYVNVAFKAVNTCAENGEVNRGVIKTCNGYMEDINESKVKKEKNKLYAKVFGCEEYNEIFDNTLVSMNVWGFDEKLFDTLENKFKTFLNNLNATDLKAEFLIPDVINEEIHNGNVKVKVIETASKWYGVTYKEDKETVVNAINNMVKEGIYPDNLWQ